MGTEFFAVFSSGASEYQEIYWLGRSWGRCRGQTGPGCWLCVLTPGNVYKLVTLEEYTVWMYSTWLHTLNSNQNFVLFLCTFTLHLLLGLHTIAKLFILLFDVQQPYLGLVKVGFETCKLWFYPIKISLWPRHIQIGFRLEFAHSGIFLRQTASVHLRRFEVTRVEYFHPEVVPQQLCTHADTAQLVVASVECALLLHSGPVIPGGNQRLWV